VRQSTAPSFRLPCDRDPRHTTATSSVTPPLPRHRLSHTRDSSSSSSLMSPPRTRHQPTRRGSRPPGEGTGQGRQAARLQHGNTGLLPPATRVQGPRALSLVAIACHRGSPTLGAQVFVRPFAWPSPVMSVAELPDLTRFRRHLSSTRHKVPRKGAKSSNSVKHTQRENPNNPHFTSRIQ
jgi:hypothetical protein